MEREKFKKLKNLGERERERERERKMMTPTMTSTDDDEIETQNDESNLVVKTPKLDEYKFSSHTMSLMKTATYVFLFFFFKHLHISSIDSTINMVVLYISHYSLDH